MTQLPLFIVTACKSLVVLKSFMRGYLLSVAHVSEVPKLPSHAAMYATLSNRFKHLFSTCHLWLSILLPPFAKPCRFSKGIMATYFSPFLVFLFFPSMCYRSLLLWPPRCCSHEIISFVKVFIQKISFSLFASPLNFLIVALLDFNRTTCHWILRGPHVREVWTRHPDTH